MADAFTDFLDYCAKKAPALDHILKKEELVVVDVGSGTMPYADNLYSWIEQYSNPRLFAVDTLYGKLPKKKISNYMIGQPKKPLTLISRSIEDSAADFLREGVMHVDLFTIFNPSPAYALPDVTKLGKLSNKSIVLLTFGEMPLHEYAFKNEMKMQGMDLLTEEFENPYKLALKGMKSIFVFDYSPVIIARAP